MLDEKYMDYYFKILNLLRTNNINSEIYSGSSGFKGQLKYADKRNCKYAIICGDDEVSKGLVTLKNLVLGSKASEIYQIKRRLDKINRCTKNFSFI